MINANNCCGTCKHTQRDTFGDYACTNPKSEYLADFTEYNHVCEEYEERE